MLSSYAYENDVEGLKRAILKGANVNEIDHSKFTPLHWASMKGNLDAIKVLHENGADFSIKNDNGNTPLLLVSEKGFIECVKFMVEVANANIEARNRWGATCVQMACVFGNFDIMKYLVEEKGASLSVVNKYGASPLHFAFAGGQVEIIRYLILRELGDKFASSTPQAINFFLASRFEHAAKKKVPLLSISNMKLIPTKCFLEANEFPIYARCASSGWHVDGGVITESSNVLFISHRWETPHHPDPSQTQYNLVVQFIKQHGITYDYVWLDYACITQDKTDPLFLVHLANIPTALFCANECLVIPKVDMVGEGYVTNLGDYLQRGWCQLEAIVAMFTGCETHVCYSAGDMTTYQKLVPYRGTHKAGFTLASEKSLAEVPRSEYEIRRQARGYWEGLSEPTEALKKFTDAVIVCHHQYPNIFQNIISMSIDDDDMQFMYAQRDDVFLGDAIRDAYQNIGVFTAEEDRIIVVRLLMFSIAYCMYDLEKEGYFKQEEVTVVEALDEDAGLEQVKAAESASAVKTDPVQVASALAPTALDNAAPQEQPIQVAPVAEKNSCSCGCSVM